MLKKVSERKRTFSHAEISFESEGCPSNRMFFFRKDALRRKKLKIGILHNHSENSSVAQDQKSTKRSPSRLGKHISFSKKPQKPKIAKIDSKIVAMWSSGNEELLEKLKNFW